jgi:AcrR family transcriptional regulator
LLARYLVCASNKAYPEDVTSSETQSTKTRRSRAQSVRHTDDRVLGALERLVSRGGWDAVTAAGVAREAGLSVGAVYSRAESISELANQAWTRSIGLDFFSHIADIVNASRCGDAAVFDEEIIRFDRWAVTASPAVELAIASFFNDELDEVVGQSLRDGLDQIIWSKGQTRHESACATLVLSYFCGRAMARCRLTSMPDVDKPGRVVLQSFWTSPAEEFTEEDHAGIEFLRPTVSELGDSISQHVIEVLGQYGYRRATVSRIARRAGLTPGAVLPSGSTKAALVASAAVELVMSPLEVWESFVDRSGRDTTGTARARFVRGIVRPEHEQMRRVNLELARIAESVAEFVAFRAPRDVLQQTHQGLMFVACFTSGLHDLPYLGPFRAGSAT